MLIPAICDNPVCGHVWLNPSPVGGRGTMFVSRCAVGPCPRCGALGSIPDGMYSDAGVRIFDPNQVAKVVNALEQLRARVANGATTDEIEREIEQRHPILDPLRPYLPKNAGDLAQYLLLVVGTIGLLQQCSVPKPSITNNVSIREEVSIVLKESSPTGDDAKRPTEPLGPTGP